MYRNLQDVVPQTADLNAHLNKIARVGWEPVALVAGEAKESALSTSPATPCFFVHVRRLCTYDEAERQAMVNVRDAMLTVIAKKRQEAPKAAWPVLDELAEMLKPVGQPRPIAQGAANAEGDKAGGLDPEGR